MPAERNLTITPIAKPDFPKVMEIKAPNINGNMALVECIIPQTDSFKPMGLIKTMMQEDGGVSFSFTDEDDGKTVHNFDLKAATEMADERYDLPVIKATLEVPVTELQFFFPKATGKGRFSIFNSNILASSN